MISNNLRINRKIIINKIKHIKGININNDNETHTYNET